MSATSTTTPSSTIRLLIAEDQTLVRSALKVLLELENDLRVVAEAANGNEVLRAVESGVDVDVYLLDIEMPELDGLATATQLRALKRDARMIMLTTFARAGYLGRAMEAGAQGYLLKDTSATALASAIRRVHEGGRVVDPELAAEALREPNPMNDRERQILALAERGDTSPQIADALGLSAGTVRNYLSSAMDKMGATTRIEAARIARDKGWLEG